MKADETHNTTLRTARDSEIVLMSVEEVERAPILSATLARAANREEFPDYRIKPGNVVQIYKIMLMVRF